MKAKIEQRTAWRKKYYQFDKLLEGYPKYQQKQAPNSYKNSMIYMELYVLPFFLELKKANNLNNSTSSATAGVYRASTTEE
jgi:hypothetical protein